VGISSFLSYSRLTLPLRKIFHDSRALDERLLSSWQRGRSDREDRRSNPSPSFSPQQNNAARLPAHLWIFLHSPNLIAMSSISSWGATPVQPIFYQLKLPLLLAMSLFQTVYLASGIPHTSSGTYVRGRALTTVVNHYPLPSLPLDSASQRALSCMSSAGRCYWACCRLAHRALKAFHLFEPTSTAFHPSHTLAA
jgi:hypothetical protein